MVYDITGKPPTTTELDQGSFADYRGLSKSIARSKPPRGIDAGAESRCERDIWLGCNLESVCSALLDMGAAVANYLQLAP
jgi:hypothetical protein